MPADAPMLPRLPINRPTTINYTVTAETEIGSPNVQSSKASQMIGYMAPGVVRKEIAEGNLRGVYFSPQNEGPHPAVMLVTGSGGGANETMGALLASKGFATLAIAHFSYEGRPSTLMDVPLEYFRNGMDWVRSTAGAERVALVGRSRGGEGVLVIASHWPEKVGAVIANVPSNIAWPGCCGVEEANRPTWTLNGKGIPTAPYSFEEGKAFHNSTEIRNWRRFFMPAMLADDKGVIAVEKIEAPILLISGEADAIWSSSIASELVIARLKRNNFPYFYEHISYSGVGHFAAVPQSITSMTGRPFLHPITKT